MEKEIQPQEEKEKGGMNAVMDANALFKEEIVTDRRVGTIRVLTPITVEGERDDSRRVIFIGESQVMTQMGALPITFEIKAANLAAAVAAYPEACKEGLVRTVRELQEMRRQAASQIVLPGQQGFQVPPEAGAGSGIAMP